MVRKATPAKKKIKFQGFPRFAKKFVATPTDDPNIFIVCFEDPVTGTFNKDCQEVEVTHG